MVWPRVVLGCLQEGSVSSSSILQEFGAFGTESCTTRAHGNRAWLFLPINLSLIYYVPAQQGGMPALQGLRYLGCAVNEAIVLIKPPPGTLSWRGLSLPMQ